MKPAIQRVLGLSSYHPSSWRCTGDGVCGFGATPEAAYDDWQRSHATTERLCGNLLRSLRPFDWGRELTRG